MDVLDLARFYETSLGQMTARLLRRRLRKIWPDLHGLNIAGIGFCVPFFRPFAEEARRSAILMPAEQGATHWPKNRPNLTALAETDSLPLADNSLDRILLIHLFETEDNLRIAMREVWRVLDGGGRLLVVAPNRAGVWARTIGTPFAQGKPYTTGQLERELRDMMFVPEHSTTALFAPPLPRRWVLRLMPLIERIGTRWLSFTGGVVIIEAGKRVYAPTPVASAPVRVLKPHRVAGSLSRNKF
ncbi:MAG: methyltransferase domain-containing protein [Pseudomonadota bacterium]|nr:methyltransferase domain-containing protein [Pseudomonadota bacterium]